jgi:hypothetical protein
LGPFLAPISGSVTVATHSGKGRLAAPNVAPQKRQPASPGIAFLAQAQIGWQLWNYQCSDLPPGMTLLRMNLDETSVAFWHPLEKGTIVLENPYVARTATASTKATHAQQRTALTHTSRSDAIGPTCNRSSRRFWPINDTTRPSCSADVLGCSSVRGWIQFTLGPLWACTVRGINNRGTANRVRDTWHLLTK